MWAFNIPKDAYQMGTSRIFFKTGKIALLDAVLKVCIFVNNPDID
jgi:myosin-6